MAYDDLLRRYQEAGAEFLESARARAEELFRELQRVGETTQEHLEAIRQTRQGTDMVVELVRKELTTQVAHVSEAARSELGRMFDALEAMAKEAARGAASGEADQAPEESPALAPGAGASEAHKVRGAKKAGAAKNAVDEKKAAAGEPPAKKSAAKKAAKKAPGAKKTAGVAKKAPGAKKAAGAAKKAAGAKKTAPPPTAE